jgi:hypothetical protein
VELLPIVRSLVRWLAAGKDFRYTIRVSVCDQRARRPSTSRNADVIDKMRTLIMKDRRLNVLEIADEVRISRNSASTI